MPFKIRHYITADVFLEYDALRRASEKQKGTIQYGASYGLKDGEAVVWIETFGGDELKNLIDAKVANAPSDHPLKQATVSQGKRNKNKWAWSIAEKIDKADNGLIQWYVDTLLAVYTFMEA
jgi:hypothetical protein